MAADTSRNTSKLTRGSSSQNKNASSPAASATHAVSVPTKPPTGIEPASESKSRRDRPNVVSRGEGEVLSCVPPDAERDTYLLLDDFGRRLVRLAGDAESINRPTQIQDLLDVQ
jgi:hypothetical protein